jgi:guanine deaminase
MTLFASPPAAAAAACDVSAAWALQCTAFDAPASDQLRVQADVLVCVNAQGVIEAVLHQGDPRRQAAQAAHAAAGTLRILPAGSYLLPGMVDLHVHAPQWPQNGKALDVPLEVWLQDNTFPLEARYRDPAFAQRVYDVVVPTLLANGTTTAMYFGTVDNAGNQVLAERCLAHGQRALVGKVAMDEPTQCPPYYKDASAAQAVADTQAFMDWLRAHPANAQQRVLPVITPRFIPSCTDALLQGLGDLAQRTGAHVQTHCSESDWAHGHVLARTGTTDAHALHRFGLMTRRTVVAHANFLTPEDVALMARTGASVAHCPLSNFYFANSVFPARTGLQQQLGLGLATDISGGYSPSMFDACRHAMTAALALHEGTDPDQPSSARGRAAQGRPAKIDHVFALWLATAAGGQALDLPIGRLEPGYAMDAIAVDCLAPDSNIWLWAGEDSDADVLQKIMHNATRANVAQGWVQGQQVHART